MLDLLMIILVEDPTPEPTEVKAGPLGFAVWIFMILAVVVISFSLVKQLRKAQAAKDAGLYGDEPVVTEDADPADAADPGASDSEGSGTRS
jgi:hypothetical protein